MCSTSGSGDVTTHVSGDANIKLALETDLSTKVLPTLYADLNVKYHIPDFDLASGVSGFGATPSISLDNIQLDLGSIVDFLASVFGPVINDIFGSFPLGPLIDIATAPLPIIDPATKALGLTKLFDEVGPDGVINLLDIAAYFGADKDVLSDFALAFSLIKGISEASSGGGTTRIDLGSLSLLGDAPSSLQAGNTLQIPNSYSVGDAAYVPPAMDPLQAAKNGLGGNGDLGAPPTNPKPGLGGILEPLVKVLNQAGLDIPLLTDPEGTVKALLLNGFGGPAVTLIQYDVPELAYKATYEQFFPIIGPIGLGFSGTFSTSIDVNFGYDTSFLKTGNFVDGFYLTTPMLQKSMNGQDYAPAATMGVEIDAAAGINLGFVSVEVGGGLAANLSAYLDADAQGRLHLSNPGCIIDPIAGEFDATVFVKFSINFIFFSWSHRFDIADITLAEFEFGCHQPTTDQAHGHGLAELNGVTLNFHTGDTAELREINGQKGVDKGEHYEVRNATDANRVLVATIGGSVRPGEPLVEIVPLDDALVVEADVKPSDIAFIHPGQHATVKLTAYDYSVYGALDGTVERISPDAIVNERTGESHFTIRVRTVHAALKAQDGTPLPIGAGMIAEVDVLGHKRSVLSYLLTPISKLRDNAFREK